MNKFIYNVVLTGTQMSPFPGPGRTVQFDSVCKILFSSLAKTKAIKFKDEYNRKHINDDSCPPSAVIVVSKLNEEVDIDLLDNPERKNKWKM